MKTDLYNQAGEVIKQIELPDEVFGLKINPDLLHQVMVAQLGNARQVLAHTKDRSEVRGGGKKPWRQKGTGRARHGSTRSPIWRHGGVTFGPTKDRNFSKGINKKMKRKALFMALSGKAQDRELKVIDSLNLEKPKTKLIDQVLRKLTKTGSLVLVTPDTNKAVEQSARNLPYAKVLSAKSLNVLDILNNKNLLLLEGAVSVIQEHFKI